MALSAHIKEYESSDFTSLIAVHPYVPKMLHLEDKQDHHFLDAINEDILNCLQRVCFDFLVPTSKKEAALYIQLELPTARSYSQTYWTIPQG